MNNKKAKEIRKIINPEDKITRRVYRRAKKQYSKTPNPLKSDFLSSLKNLLKSDLNI